MFSDHSHLEDSYEEVVDSGRDQPHRTDFHSSTINVEDARRGTGLNKSLNNTSPGFKKLAENERKVINSTERLEKEVGSPLAKGGSKMKTRPSKRLQSANDRAGSFFKGEQQTDNFMVKRDNFLRGGTAPKLSPAAEKHIPLKPMSLVGLQEDSPPFPSTSQLEKYKRAVLASPNERSQGFGFSLTSAARWVSVT